MTDHFRPQSFPDEEERLYGSFWSDFGHGFQKGFGMVMNPVKQAAEAVLPVVGGPEGAAAGAALHALPNFAALPNMKSVRHAAMKAAAMTEECSPGTGEDHCVPRTCRKIPILGGHRCIPNAQAKAAAQAAASYAMKKL